MKLSRGMKRFLLIALAIVALFVVVVIVTDIATGFIAGLHQSS
ncbi:hypothetical protein NZD89_04690 [Alicyclobacillus fastidiosus]|uniref:DUF4044 domain-containing protein n=1 Tax=Alicyclobacillus fastidiosus TaxID=392011 RepID=A0ABY6ZIS7_9BACL|nr:hypothetical protein [Alicyclobacillus fastidiosus]WAH42736.1 hypothetical protein NZD89_04690 [Alicyclobacillus fastidiosus]GMA64638.1 hypothetical protein GCM10025859_50780 [Alicyclobacillus fastidiosus]